MYNFSCLANVVGTRALPLHFHEMIYFRGGEHYIFYFRLSLKGVLWKCTSMWMEKKDVEKVMFSIKYTLICVVLERTWMRRMYTEDDAPRQIKTQRSTKMNLLLVLEWWHSRKNVSATWLRCKWWWHEKNVTRALEASRTVSKLMRNNF